MINSFFDVLVGLQRMFGDNIDVRLRGETYWIEVAVNTEVVRNDGEGDIIVDDVVVLVSEDCDRDDGLKGVVDAVKKIRDRINVLQKKDTKFEFPIDDIKEDRNEHN